MAEKTEVCRSAVFLVEAYLPEYEELKETGAIINPKIDLNGF